MMVGAVLTQNTAWINVEKAIHNLKQAGCLNLTRMQSLPDHELAELIRPSGFFKLKSTRLKNLCDFLLQQGGESAVADNSTETLRPALLSVNGIGPETADAILLYGFFRPVFVIDAYTRRIFSRIGLVDGQEGYEALRAEFEKRLGLDAALFNEYHALIVCHAKMHCKTKPICDSCFICDQCANKID